jgi:hypothetical protein
MWQIKWTFVVTGEKGYINESFFSGRKLIFKWEEQALRFLQPIQKITCDNGVAVRYMVERYNQKLDKECKAVETGNFDKYMTIASETIARYVEA